MVSSNSTSGSIMIIIVIISSSIVKISVSLTISTSIFELLICFLLFYINILHHCFFWRGHNGNKVTHFFCVISAISPYGQLFTTIFNFNEFIFVYVVNILFICDGEIYLLTRSCIKHLRVRARCIWFYLINKTQRTGNNRWLFKIGVGKKTLREKCPYSELFWSVFYRIGLNISPYSLFLRIQSECWKIRTRITPNTCTFYSVKVIISIPWWWW